MLRSIMSMGIVIAMTGFVFAQEKEDPRDLAEQLLEVQIPIPDWTKNPLAYPWGNPPRVDAPNDVLISYWSDEHESRTLPLNDISGRHLLEVVDRFPELLPRIIFCLPNNQQTYDRVKAILDKHKFSKSELELINHRYTAMKWFGERPREEVIEAARHARVKEGMLEGRSELDWLEWKTLEPIIKNFVQGDDPQMAAVAHALIYRHYVEDDKAIEEKERGKLKTIVEDRKASPFVRDFVLRKLMQTQWPQRDEWFLGLFSDASLVNLSDQWRTYQPLKEILQENSNYWLDKWESWSETKTDAIQIMGKYLGSGEEKITDQNLKKDLARRKKKMREEWEKGLPEELTDDWVRQAIEDGLFTHQELTSAIESYLRDDANGATSVANPDDKPHLTSRLSELGSRLGKWDLLPAEENILARAATLEKSEPKVSRLMRKWICKGSSPVADREWVRCLSAGLLGGEETGELLKNASTLRKNAGDLLTAMLKLKDERKSLAVLILDDREEALGILRGNDVSQKQMLLAGARITRMALPLAEVGKLLDSKDPKLVLAAEMFLEAEDSPEARKIFLSHYPGQARILGAYCGTFLEADYRLSGPLPAEAPEVQEKEPWHNFRREVLRANGPEEIYLLQAHEQQGSNHPLIVVHIQGKKAQVSWSTKNDAMAKRELNEKEFHDFVDFINRYKVDDLGGMETRTCDGTYYYYLHLTKDGGRCIWMNTPENRNASIYAALCQKFKVLVPKEDRTED